MIYSVDINLDDITTADIISDLYRRNDFTLTAKAVNDAPVLLQLLKDLGINVSGAAAVVHYTIFGNAFHPTFNFL